MEQIFVIFVNARMGSADELIFLEMPDVVCCGDRKKG